MTDQDLGVEIATIGRFVARIVRPGRLLYHGMTQDFTREPRDYERGHAIIEVFDPRYVGPGFSPLGQFVTAYGAYALAKSDDDGGRLSMQGGIEAWTLTPEETRVLRTLARAALAGDPRTP